MLFKLNFFFFYVLKCGIYVLNGSLTLLISKNQSNLHNFDRLKNIKLSYENEGINRTFEIDLYLINLYNFSRENHEK